MPFDYLLHPYAYSTPPEILCGDCLLELRPSSFLLFLVCLLAATEVALQYWEVWYDSPFFLFSLQESYFLFPFSFPICISVCCCLLVLQVGGTAVPASIFADFSRSHQCFALMPDNSKMVIFDSHLLVSGGINSSLFLMVLCCLVP